MRQLLFALAVLGAVLSGWVPAMAATLAAAQPAAIHAMHGEHEHGKTKPAAHPLACSACFAIEAGRLETPDRLSVLVGHVAAAMPRLHGHAPAPLDPPPRS